MSFYLNQWIRKSSAQTNILLDPLGLCSCRPITAHGRYVTSNLRITAMMLMIYWQMYWQLCNPLQKTFVPHRACRDIEYWIWLRYRIFDVGEKEAHGSSVAFCIPPSVPVYWILNIGYWIWLRYRMFETSTRGLLTNVQLSAAAFCIPPSVPGYWILNIGYWIWLRYRIFEASTRASWQMFSSLQQPSVSHLACRDIDGRRQYPRSLYHSSKHFNTITSQQVDCDGSNGQI